MKQKELTDFTDQELVQEEQKRKSDCTTYSFISGIIIGVAIYSTVKNGFGFFTFFPLFFALITTNAWTNYTVVKKEIKFRKSTKTIEL